MSLTDSSTRSLQIVSGSSSVTFTSPNLFTLRLPASGFRTSSKDECALKSLSLYYSWPNVSAALGNNSFSYSYDGVTYPVVMADGIYQFSELQSYFELVMGQNGHYLVNTDGQRVYFINLTVNSVLYCLSLTVTPVPSILPVGWSNPAGMSLTGVTPTLNVTGEISTLMGFAPASYPAAPQAGLFQLNSGIPQISHVSSLNVTSNICTNSGLSLYSDVLATFVLPDTQRPGTLVQIQPNNLDWVSVQKAQTFTEVTVAIVDQLHRPVHIRDPSGFVCTINVRRIPSS